MKTAAKVFIWIGMITQFFLIYPLILGILSLKKINNATTSSELQTLGIFTTLFCSLLGGVFMLCIADRELNRTTEITGNNVVIYKEKHITYEENEDIVPEVLKARKTIKSLLYSLIGLIVLSLVFSIAATGEYSGYSHLPLILVGIQLITYIVLMAFYIAQKHTLTNVTNALLTVFCAVSAVEIVIPHITNYFLAWKWIATYDYYDQQVYHNQVFGDGWEYWCLYAFAMVCVIITVVALYLSFQTHQNDFVGKGQPTKKISYTETSNIEIELVEIKRLFDNGTIVEEEYQYLRKGILKKYYNLGC